VIIRDLNLVDISSFPSETDPILIVDSDTVLAAPVRPQPFGAVSWWNREIDEISHAFDLIDFHSGNFPQMAGAGFSGYLGIDAVKCGLGALIQKRTYHGLHYNNDTRNRPQ
jgi:hypothetical protein